MAAQPIQKENDADGLNRIIPDAGMFITHLEFKHAPGKEQLMAGFIDDLVFFQTPYDPRATEATTVLPPPVIDAVKKGMPPFVNEFTDEHLQRVRKELSPDDARRLSLEQLQTHYAFAWVKTHYDRWLSRHLEIAVDDQATAAEITRKIESYITSKRRKGDIFDRRIALLEYLDKTLP